MEDIRFRRNKALPIKKAYPQSALRLTSPSAKGAFWHTSCKASPERGDARHRRAEGFVPQRRKGRGGSVSRRDHNYLARNRTHLSGGITYAEVPKPNASRSSGERGLGGEGLLSEKPPLPPEFPPPLSSLEEGARGRGLFCRKVPSLAIYTRFTLLEVLALCGLLCGRGGDRDRGKRPRQWGSSTKWQRDRRGWIEATLREAARSADASSS